MRAIQRGASVRSTTGSLHVSTAREQALRLAPVNAPRLCPVTERLPTAILPGGERQLRRPASLAQPPRART
jgi:hypothetical protein